MAWSLFVGVVGAELAVAVDVAAGTSECELQRCMMM
jgi:hypothetical protein